LTAASSREDRLHAELKLLEQLREASSIFQFEGTGDPPDRFTLSFSGKGVARDISANADVEMIDAHRVELRLPYAYPKVAPDVRWVTPIFHPNVSFSGFIHLADVGLPWESHVTLDIVCERLWDVARLAYIDLEKATNYSAKNWFQEQRLLKLPVDARPLRNRATPAAKNVVRYQRRGQSTPPPPGDQQAEDILYIGEDTPVPKMPSRGTRRHSDDDDVLYIGDD
jgi:hypothetical protein